MTRQTAIALLLLVPAVHGREPAIREFTDRHCLDCHDAEVRKGDLDLSSLAFAPDDPASFRRWVKIYDRVDAAEMPPKDKRQPDDDAKDAFLKQLGDELRRSDELRRTKHGRSVVRRLNRSEFEHALSDLLGIPLNLREMLPPDAKGNGFDTVGAALNVSAVQMESYLQAIDAALDSATRLIDRPKTRLFRLSYRETTGMMTEYRRNGPFLPVADGVAMFAPDFFSHFNSLLDTFVVAHDARYRVKVSAYAIRTDTPITLTVRMGGPGHKESDEVRKKLLGNVSVHPGRPEVFEFEDHLERGQMFRIYPSSLRKMRFEGKAWQNRQREYLGPAVVVQWVEVEGPLYDSWPPASHRRLFGDTKTEPLPDTEPNDDPNRHLESPPDKVAAPRLKDPKLKWGGEKIYRRTRVNQPLRATRRLAPDHPRADAARLLRDFVPLAFRRPVNDEEIRPFIQLAHRWLEAGVGFEDSLRAAYKAVLTSPGFLYHRGGRPVPGGPLRLTEHQLAERLAFSLWSSLPDATLVSLADRGALRDNLPAQVDRMLSDPRSDRFLEDFLGQWLDLRLIDFTSPDSDLYPEFDPLLQWSMVGETKAFFRELLARDLSVTNVIGSRFAMLNDRLARHYGIPDVRGVEFRPVLLPVNSPRGGVMTQASVLKVTSNGTTTSPVVRGVWLMNRILGVQPNPPPPGVPAIEPDIRGATTVREQLASHRSMASCASCHAKIDPPGVALENFDVIGGWRDAYRAIDLQRDMSRVKYLPDRPPPPRHVRGLPVDSRDMLPDGRPFADVREFKQLLLREPDQTVQTIAEKLIVYFTGAPASFADRAEIQEIVSQVRKRDRGFRTLIQAVIQSAMFQSR